MTDENSKLVAYHLGMGAIVCVDCDIHPPDSTDIREGNKLIETADCDSCGQPLKEVAPIS